MLTVAARMARWKLALRAGSTGRTVQTPVCTLRDRQECLPYLASNQKRRHAEQSEARAQAYRPVLDGDRQECLSLPGVSASNQKRRHAEHEARAQASGSSECLRAFPRNPRDLRNFRNFRNNFVAPGISARENRAGGRLWSWLCLAYGGRRAGGKSFFCKTNPKVPLESTKRWVR